MESDSSEDVSVPKVEEPVKKTVSKSKKVLIETPDVVLTKPPRKKVEFSEERKAKLAIARAKGLEKLSQLRREKAALKEEAKKQEAEVKKVVEEKKLDAAPKVREIDGTVAALRAEMEALKKELAASKAVKEEKPAKKVKKIVYEDEEDEEEVVEVRKKSAPRQKTITGTELLDKLFFNQ